MTGYIGVSIEDDPDELTSLALEALARGIPGFVAREASLEVWLLEVVARMTSETRYLFNLVPDSIFHYFGNSLLGLVQVEDVPATVLTAWTMVDDAGYTVAEGSQVGYRLAGDRLRVFATTGELVIPPGSTSGVAPARALESGTLANGLAPASLVLVDSLSYVSTVTTGLPTSGGVDKEEDSEYLSRLRDELQLLTPRFVLARDAAVLARRIGGVHRALGIDNYNPEDTSFGNEKMMTLAVVGEDGLALSAGVKTQVEEYLESLRELNFVLHVVDPTYTSIDVVFTVAALPGYPLADLTSRATAAVSGYLSPAAWAGGSETPPSWKPSQNIVRFLEVAEVLNRVEGVDYVDTLTLNGGGVNVALTGVAPLTEVGTITGNSIHA